METPTKNNALIPLSIVIAGLLIAGAVYGGSSRNANPAVAAGQENQAAKKLPSVAVDIGKVKIAGEPFVGDANAPATVAYWFDYQCPFCLRFENDSIRQMMADYVQTGKVKLVFKDFQFLGPDSVTAGLIGRAVWEVAPDKYLAWHEAMYQKQDGENSGWGSQSDVLILTKTILGSANTDAVSKLIVSRQAEYQKAMDADQAEGKSFGISGTPGMVIGKQLLPGAYPYASVKQAIDLALQGK